jgi:hypothetical protein
MKNLKFKLEVFFIIVLWLFACNGGFAQCFTDDPVEVGVKFTVREPGTITEIKYGNCNTVPFAVKLYDGTNLVSLPYKTIPGVTYTASYFTTEYQAVDEDVWPKVDGNVTYLMSAYKYGGGFPTDVYKTSNYFITVDFNPDVIHDTVYIKDTTWVILDNRDTIMYPFTDFKIVEFSTYQGKRMRYRHYITEAIKREEWDELTKQWIEK